jgi:RNA polymerase sigma-70 factor (ECF subfamily)
MTGDHHSGQDVLQEAFIVAFRQLHQLKQPEHFGGWLKRIVINECIRYSKKQQFSYQLDDETTEIAYEEAAGTDWWKDIDMQLIHQEISNLPEGCRQVFTLHVFENYMHREIAETLGITESTSKTQYRRAKELLKARITKASKTYGQV